MHTSAYVEVDRLQLALKLAKVDMLQYEGNCKILRAYALELKLAKVDRLQLELKLAKVARLKYET